ncbi:MAG: hypothetical protein CSA40_01795 [Flavobacteriales bacterium]|nr:MAG: hypothetical protein CSA40_01795 [Flavobacteriales bacterium]
MAGSLINSSRIADAGIKISDKVLHASAYTVLMISWLMYTTYAPIKVKDGLLFIILAIFGIIIELLQGSLTQSRTGDFLDVIANIIGLIIGLLIFKYLIKGFLH